MAELIRMSARVVTVPFESSRSLERKVDAGAAWPGHLRADPHLDGLALPTVPIELLLHIGQATAFLPYPRDAATWMWPVARYLPALAINPSGHLHLDPSVRTRVVKHQAGAIAEAFGAAAGCLLASQYLWLGAAVDVDDLDLIPSHASWHAPPGRRTQPDLWLRPATGHIGALVETKGSSTRVPFGALRKGTEQLDGQFRIIQQRTAIDRWLVGAYGLKTDAGLRAVALRVSAITTPSGQTRPLTSRHDRHVADSEGLRGFVPDLFDESPFERRGEIRPPNPERLERLDRIETSIGECRGRRYRLDTEHDLFVGATESAIGEAVDPPPDGRTHLPPRQYREFWDDRALQEALGDDGAIDFTTSLVDLDDGRSVAASPMGQVVALERRSSP